MVIEAGALLPYRRLVLSIPTVHVKVGADLDSSYEQGILFPIPRGLITRSLGTKTFLQRFEQWLSFSMAAIRSPSRSSIDAIRGFISLLRFAQSGSDI
jgi:hypothetical protein